MRFPKDHSSKAKCMKRGFVTSCVLALVLGVNTWAQHPAVGDKAAGITAVYSEKLNGHKTANGQIYDSMKLTAAHKTLPFGTIVKITNPKNNRSVVVRINDRGPMQGDRMLDISSAAAARLHIGKNVTHEVSMEVVSVGSGKRVE